MRCAENPRRDRQSSISVPPTMRIRCFSGVDATTAARLRGGSTVGAVAKPSPSAKQATGPYLTISLDSGKGLPKRGADRMLCPCSATIRSWVGSGGSAAPRDPFQSSSRVPSSDFPLDSFFEALGSHGGNAPKVPAQPTRLASRREFELAQIKNHFASRDLPSWAPPEARKSG